LNKDTKLHLQHLYQDGFRTGVAQGQEEKVQDGFDIGYEQGMQEGIAWGTCQGVLEMYKALKSQMDDQVLSQKLSEVTERTNSVSKADAYVHSFNKLAASQENALKNDKGYSVFPQMIEGAKDVTNEISDVKRVMDECGF